MQKEIIIRSFQKKDFRSVIEIMIHSFSGKFNALSKWEPAELLDFIKSGGMVDRQPFDGYIVAEMNHSVVGVLCLTFKNQKRNCINW